MYRPDTNLKLSVANHIRTNVRPDNKNKCMAGGHTYRMNQRIVVARRALPLRFTLTG